MKSHQILALLVLAAACAGEPFVEFSETKTVSRPVPVETGEAGEQTGEAEAGMPGVGGTDWSNQPTGNGKIPSSPVSYSGSETAGGSFGEDTSGVSGAGGSVEPEAVWQCREESGLCQCYSEGDFPSGWSNTSHCASIHLCTLRDSVACVCWESELSYQSALGVMGTEAVDKCPQ